MDAASRLNNSDDLANQILQFAGSGKSASNVVCSVVVVATNVRASFIGWRGVIAIGL